MHRTPTIKRILKGITLRKFQGQLCRAVNAGVLYGSSTSGPYVPRPLYNLGPASGGARFTPKGGAPSLYLAEDYETSTREFLQLGLPATLVPTTSSSAFVTYVADVHLESVLDLTERRTRRLLGTTLAELKGPWRYRKDRRTPPTHRLGQAVADDGNIEAIRFPSSKGPGNCFVILTDVVAAPSFVRVTDPQSRLVASIP